MSEGEPPSSNLAVATRPALTGPDTLAQRRVASSSGTEAAEHALS
jgi:hypothetical protein